jgi:hypothetical protein
MGGNRHVLAPPDQQVQRKVGAQLVEGPRIPCRTELLRGQSEPMASQQHLIDPVGDVQGRGAVLALGHPGCPVGVRLAEVVVAIGRPQHPGLVVELVAQLLDGAGDHRDVELGVLPQMPPQERIQTFGELGPFLGAVQPVSGDLGDRGGPVGVELAGQAQLPDVGQVGLQEQRHVELMAGAVVAQRPHRGDLQGGLLA